MEIKNLTKIYKTKGKKDVIALNDISFCLPDQGMVFIIGKSGSGKSTLLNVIGGIDNFSEGDIIIKGNNLKDFNNQDYEKYRSSVTTFIFQDYHLLEELTVKENIELFSNKKLGDDEIDEYLEKVDLKGYGARSISELSGGEAQRIAILRALIKDPSIFLCDEPTGNLDNYTSLKIMDILKEISKTKLVLVVSHDIDIASSYADKILELSYGKLISNRIKEEGYFNSLEIKGDNLYLPYQKKLTEEDIDTINLNKSNKHISQKNDGFIDDTNNYISYNKEDINIKNITKENERLLGKKYLFSGISKMLVTSLIIAFIFSLFAIIESFLMFDKVKATIESSVIIEGNYVINYRNDREFYYFTDEDKEYLDTIGKTYEFYNLYFSLVNEYTSYQNDTENNNTLINNYGNFYTKASPGLLFCDEEYLTSIFGIDNDIKLIGGSLDECLDSSKVIITDYMADSLIYWSIKNKYFYFNNYEDILTKYLRKDPTGPHDSMVGAIIDTGYKNKYKEIKDEFDKVSTGDATLTEVREHFEDSDIYQDFINEALTYLGIFYCISDKETYLENYIPENKDTISLNRVYIKNPSNEEVLYLSDSISFNYDETKKRDLYDNDIIIQCKYYNEIFGTDYDVTGVTLMDDLGYIELYRYFNDSNEPYMVITSKVVGLTSNQYSPVGSVGLLKSLGKMAFNPTRLYITNVKDKNALIDYTTKHNYSFVSSEQNGISDLVKMTDTFNNLFIFLMVLVGVGLFVYIVMYGVSSIKQHLYQIGVLKAMGVRDKTITKVFITRVVVHSIFFLLIASIFSVFAQYLSNIILTDSITDIYKISFENLKIIEIRPLVTLIDFGVMLALIVISAIINILFLKSIKPISIIKAKE